MKRKKPGSLRIRWNLHTLSLTGVVLSMGYAGAVQNNGAAYVLCFLTLVLALMSWLRARENLRSLEVTAGRLTGGRAGEVSRLPLEVHASTGQGVWGVEVLSPGGAGRWSFIEEIKAGQSTHVTLPVKTNEAGIEEEVSVLLRSSYPLGLFSAERVVRVESARRIHPKPEGSQPLPAPTPLRAGDHPSVTPAGGRPGREGDDFAGLREWQIGDSLKHVDWRAVARGRPLLVKQWANGSNEALVFDWEKLDLPDTARAKQMARWIEEAETSGTPYAMRLPGVQIETGLGAAHARRCLDALTETSPVTKEAGKPVRHLPAGHEHSAHLPPWPLLVLCLFLLGIATLLLDVVPVIAVLLLAVCVGWRLGIAEKGWKKRASQVMGVVTFTSKVSFLSLGVLIVGVLLIQFATGNLLSMEGGIAVLLVLIGGKLVESRTPHDFQVLGMVGWFLCLCCVLSDQTLNRALWTFAIFTGICVCMVRFRRGKDGWGPPLKLTGTMLAQALPVAVLLFFIFPRSSVNFLERLGTERSHVTGVSESMEPGRISEVAKSEKVAFRVEFPETEPPEPAARYWRCIVLWQCDDGLTWQKGLPLKGTQRAWPRRTSDAKQVVTLEPHGQKWVPGLDMPIQALDDGSSVLPDTDSNLRLSNSVDSLRRFTVWSRITQERDPLISEEQRHAALRLPQAISPRIKELGREIRGQAQTNTQIAQQAIAHLQKQNFEYTLEPGTYTGPEALDQFLFDRRVGFCEHFSGAFATLMRAAGVPARIVIGYMGGEWSDRGNYLIVRQSDAHAWTEIWIEDQGWTRVDPTAALVPGRMTLDLRTLLAGGEEELARQNNSLLWRTLTGLRLWWDSVEYDWYSSVINFDEEAQIAWLNWLGLGQFRGQSLVLVLVFGGVLLLALFVLLLWLRRPAPVRDPWQRVWLQLCLRLERLGAPARQPSEGPLNYAERVARARPAIADQVRTLAREYAEVRYGREPAARDWRAFQQSLQSLG